MFFKNTFTARNDTNRVHVRVFIGHRGLHKSECPESRHVKARARAGPPWRVGCHSHHGFRSAPELCGECPACTAVGGDPGHKVGQGVCPEAKREWLWVQQSPGRTVVPWKQCGDETRGTEQETLSTEELSPGSLLTVQRARQPCAQSIGARGGCDGKGYGGGQREYHGGRGGT